MQLKFKSGINKLLIPFVAIYNVVVILLFSTKFFMESMFGVKAGIAFLVIDLVLVIPMLFLTSYEFKEDYLYIREYPIRTYKIKYSDIFNVEDGDFETRDKKIVALSLDRVAIGYNKKNKKDETEKKYIFISPADMSLFLIRLSGKLQKYETDIEEKAKEITAKQAEHLKKKAVADENRKEAEKEKEPEIIRVSGVKKFDSFKAEVKEEDEPADDNPQDGKNK